MADIVDNLMLEHLKRFQATRERMDGQQAEAIVRLSNPEGFAASPMQHLGPQAASIAGQQLAIDSMNQRLDRIERRLELTH